MAINFVPMSLPQGTSGAGGISDPADEAMLKRYYLEQMARSLDAQPIQSWTQGAAKMMQAGIAGMQLRRMREERQQNMSSAADLIARALQGQNPAAGGGITGQGAPPPPSAAVSPPPPPAQTMPIPGGSIPHIAGFPIGAEGEGNGPATMMPGIGVQAPVPPPGSPPPPIAPPVDPSVARAGDNQPMNALSRFDDSGRWMGPPGADVAAPPVPSAPPPAPVAGGPPMPLTPENAMGLNDGVVPQMAAALNAAPPPPSAPPPQASAPGITPDMLPQIAMALNAPPDAQAPVTPPQPDSAPPAFNGPTSPAQMQALVAALNGDQGVTMSTPPPPDVSPFGKVMMGSARDDGMVPLTTGSGAKLVVSNSYADRFRGALADLEAAGINIRGGQSGGFNDRNIAGTNTKSQHAYGRAIDVNWDENARGSKGVIPADLARSIAKKWGLTWGGDWRNPDPMHFEVDRKANPNIPRQPVAPSGPPPPVQIAQAGGGNGSLSPDTLRQMMMNPYTRDFALKMVGNQLDPSNRLKMEGMELDNATKRRELNTPKDTLQKVKTPDGGEVLLQVDPRTGTWRQVYGGDANGQRKLAPDERKAILESDDALAASKSVLGTLDQLDQLNKSAYDGPTANLRSTLMAPLGSKDAQDTQVLRNLTTEKALQQLRTTFGGNPTEGERKVLLDLQGSANQPAAVRQRIFNNARQAVQKRIAIEQQRAGQLRSGNYFQPGGGGNAGIEGAKTIGGSSYVKINGQWFQQ